LHVTTTEERFRLKSSIVSLQRQAAQLRDFNRRGDPEAVIRAFESGAAVSSEETLGEYVKALVQVDRLDSSSLLKTLQVRAWNCDAAVAVESSLLLKMLLVCPGCIAAARVCGNTAVWS